MTDNDCDLVASGQRGDTGALETLYLRYLPTVWRYVCARLGGDWHAAEDVVSETFLAAVRALGDFNPRRGPFAAWLIGIARNKLNDHHRRRGRAESSLQAAVEDRRAGNTDDPAATDESEEHKTLIEAVTASLTDDERLVLEWKYIDELSVREIASRLGRTESATESLLFRARDSFRTLADRWRGQRHD